MLKAMQSILLKEKDERDALRAEREWEKPEDIKARLAKAKADRKAEALERSRLRQIERKKEEEAAAEKTLEETKIQQAKVQAQVDVADSIRRDLVGSGDRSERIRTYNFPQGRMTDHRINLTLYKLDSIMEGDLDEILDALLREHQADLMASIGGEM